ncbi:MAG TPA: hypothetical protein VNA26_09450 [Chitinophagaceae bacterium]|nr:hypothetical protein [Chitinophagaceae bacterium]
MTGNGDKENAMIVWNGLLYSHGFKIGSRQMVCDSFLLSSPSPRNTQGLEMRPLDLFSVCFYRVTIITTLSFLLLFSLLIKRKSG